jgi:hypothetical protein
VAARQQHEDRQLCVIPGELTELCVMPGLLCVMSLSAFAAPNAASAITREATKATMMRPILMIASHVKYGIGSTGNGK